MSRPHEAQQHHSLLFRHSILFPFFDLIIDIQCIIYEDLFVDMCAQPLLDMDRALTDTPEYPEDKIHKTFVAFADGKYAQTGLLPQQRHSWREHPPQD